MTRNESMRPPNTRKCALVTGASRGIGYATVLALLADGWDVHGTFNRSDEKAETLLSENRNIAMHQVDLASNEGAGVLIQAVTGVQFDAIVNNAGICEAE